MLEKQNEVNISLRSFRDNLEAISRAGENNNNIVNNINPGPNPYVVPSPAVTNVTTATSEQKSSNSSPYLKKLTARRPVMNLPDDEDDPAVIGGGGGGSNKVSASVRFKSVTVEPKPSMDGVKLQGQILQGPVVQGPVVQGLQVVQKQTSKGKGMLKLKFQQEQPQLSVEATTPVKDELLDYLFFRQSQFVADLCINFEDISFKKKRVVDMPAAIGESIAEVSQEVSEFIAKTADTEMVRFVILSITTSASPVTKDDISYDENFIISRRRFKVEEFVNHVKELVQKINPSPGITRVDARTLFLSTVRKCLDLFMSKHNQVLTVGNSRLGRVKIPSCIACDRPLMEKTSLERAATANGPRDHRLYSTASNMLADGEDVDGMSVGSNSTYKSMTVNNKVVHTKSKGMASKSSDNFKLPMMDAT